MIRLLVYTLSAMFIVGLVGCVIVVPLTAARLFAVLFEHDPKDEQSK